GLNLSWPTSGPPRRNFVIKIVEKAPIASVRFGHSSFDSEALGGRRRFGGHRRDPRSEEHTSELQSLTNLVCRLLLEKKKQPNMAANSALDKCMVFHLITL